MKFGALLKALPLALLLASLAGGGLALGRIVLKERENRTISRLASGKDAPVAPTASPDVLFARVHFLLVRDRIDEAQPLAEEAARSASPHLQAALLYDMANARMRMAFSLIEATQIDKALPQLRLAKEDYRRALRLDPGFWDARYNLDVVMRMARDFPEIEPHGDDEAPASVSKLWTDLPGLPRGLP